MPYTYNREVRLYYTDFSRIVLPDKDPREIKAEVDRYCTKHGTMLQAIYGDGWEITRPNLAGFTVTWMHNNVQLMFPFLMDALVAAREAVIKHRESLL